MKYGAKNHKLQELAKKSRLNPNSNSVDARVVAAIKKVSIEGTLFHVLASIPSQNADCYSVLIDDRLVVDFELERDASNPQPLGAEVLSVSQFRNRVGQKGSHRLEATIAAARKMLSEIN